MRRERVQQRATIHGANCLLFTGLRSRAKSQRGLTLFELLVSMAVFGLLTAIAVPSFETVSTNSSLATETNELMASLRQARSEAAKRGQNVTVCAANAALTACSGNGNWGAGWLIVDNAANVIRVREALTTNNASETSIIGAAGSIVFNRSGFSTNARTIKLCGRRNDARRARGVIISVDGRVRLATDSNSNSIVEDRSGTDLTCP